MVRKRSTATRSGAAAAVAARTASAAAAASEAARFSFSSRDRARRAAASASSAAASAACVAATCVKHARLLRAPHKSTACSAHLGCTQLLLALAFCDRRLRFAPPCRCRSGSPDVALRHALARQHSRRRIGAERCAGLFDTLLLLRLEGAAHGGNTCKYIVLRRERWTRPGETRKGAHTWQRLPQLRWPRESTRASLAAPEACSMRVALVARRTSSSSGRRRARQAQRRGGRMLRRAEGRAAHSPPTERPRTPPSRRGTSAQRQRRAARPAESAGRP